jgi:hypothetical protein
VQGDHVQPLLGCDGVGGGVGARGDRHRLGPGAVVVGDGDGARERGGLGRQSQ